MRVALALLLLVAAVAPWLVPPPLTAPPALSTASRSSEAAPLPPPALPGPQAGEAERRPPFEPGRRPPPPPDAPSIPVALAAERLVLGRWRVTGAINTGRAWLALIQDAQDGTVARLGLGDTLGDGRARVAAIEADAVTFDVGGTRERFPVGRRDD